MAIMQEKHQNFLFEIDGRYSVLKIFSQSITELTNRLISLFISDKGVCRTALATSGVLMMIKLNSISHQSHDALYQCPIPQTRPI